MPRNYVKKRKLSPLERDHAPRGIQYKGCRWAADGLEACDLLGDPSRLCGPCATYRKNLTPKGRGA